MAKKSASMIFPANKAEVRPLNKRSKSNKKKSSPVKLRNAIDGKLSCKLGWNNSFPEQWLRGERG